MAVTAVFPLYPQYLLEGKKQSSFSSSFGVFFGKLQQDPPSHFIFILISTDYFSNFKPRQIKYDAEGSPLCLQHSNTVLLRITAYATKVCPV